MAAGSDSDIYTHSVSILKSPETKLLGGLVRKSGCFSVRDREKGALLIRQTSYIEKMVEPFDLTRMSNTPASTTIDPRPRERLGEEF